MMGMVLDDAGWRAAAVVFESERTSRSGMEGRPRVRPHLPRGVLALSWLRARVPGPSDPSGRLHRGRCVSLGGSDGQALCGWPTQPADARVRGTGPSWPGEPMVELLAVAQSVV